MTVDDSRFKFRRFIQHLPTAKLKGQWRRYNFELYKLYDEPDLVKYIKINRLKWAGHDMRMDNNRINKRCLSLGQKVKEELKDLN
jgi:hypothetical protein